MFITDPGRSDEPIIYVNAAFEELTGYSCGEVEGPGDRLPRRPRDRPAGASARCGRRLDKGEEYTAELLLYRKDGKPFWATLSLAPVADAGGTVTHFVGVVTDVTERRQAEEELKRAKDDAEAARSRPRPPTWPRASSWPT